MLNGIINFVYQFVFLFGIIVLVCFIIHNCRKLYYKQYDAKTYKLAKIFDFIGVPIHESGHALMCLLFGHKINKIVFYQPNSQDGMLGYVSHSWNKKNFYQRIGGFFISLGPIILGAGILMLLMFLLLNNIFNQMMSYISAEGGKVTNVININAFLIYVNTFINNISLLFTKQNLLDFRWWIYIVMAIIVSQHMALSPIDIKNGLEGFGFLAIVFLVINIILGLIGSQALQTMNYGIIIVASWMFCFLSLAVIFNVVMVIFAFLFNRIIRLFRKKSA